MIRNNHFEEPMAMVSRMLAYELNAGKSLPEAFNSLKTSLPDSQYENICVLEKMIAGEDVQLASYGNSPLGLFNQLSQVVRSERGNIQKLFLHSQGTTQKAALQAQEYWSGFTALNLYFSTVLFMAIILLVIFSVFVLPNVEALYTSFGGVLPEFTTLMLGNDNVLFVLINFLFVLIISSLTLAHHIKQRVAQLRPLSHLMRWVPGMKKISETYRYSLFTQYAYLFCQSGLSNSCSIEQAEKLSMIRYVTSTPTVSWMTTIKTASKLNALGAEIEYQTQHIEMMFGYQMITLREKLTIVLQLFLGLLIGSLVVAMYLPIFKMGSEI